MVYFGSKKRAGKGGGPFGVSKFKIGAGPIAITSARPSLQKQVMNVKKSIKEINSKEELKYSDVFLNGTSLSSTPVLTLLNGLAIGDGVSNREGNQVSATSIQFRAFLTQAATAVDGDVVWRHIILFDSQTNGAVMSAGDILDLTVITTPTIGPYKREYQKRFKILHDKCGVLSAGTVDPTAATTEILAPRRYLKDKISLNRLIKYRNAQDVGTVADIASNSLYSYWVINGTAGQAVVTCGYRFYFKDD